MFAITHILYSSAFGMKPLNMSAGLVITAVSSLSYLLLYPYLSGPFTYLVAVYIALIGFMGWRAIAGLQLTNDLWTWTKLSACLGAVLFMVSDLTIAVNKFCFPVPHSRAIIMATYYAAQMLIALSAVECQDVEVARKRTWGTESSVVKVADLPPSLGPSDHGHISLPDPQKSTLISVWRSHTVVTITTGPLQCPQGYHPSVPLIW